MLQTNGSGVLSFAGVSASAGQVIQVLSATDSTQRTTTSTSYVTASNTLSVTITPSSASNKILIISTFAVQTDSSTRSSYTIFRDSTNLGVALGMLSLTANGTSQSGAVSFLDSPNTTSATTYQIYLKRDAVGSAYINTDGTQSSITVLEVKG